MSRVPDGPVAQHERSGHRRTSSRSATFMVCLLLARIAGLGVLMMLGGALPAPAGAAGAAPGVTKTALPSPAPSANSVTTTVTNTAKPVTVTPTAQPKPVPSPSPASAKLRPRVAPVAPLGAVIAVTKTVTPLALPLPGGTFTYTVTPWNSGAVDLRITRIVDDIYPGIAVTGTSCGSLIGVTITAGTALPPCAFAGVFNNGTTSGQQRTDTVTVNAVDANGNTVTGTARATAILSGPPVGTIGVTKTANPTSLPAPGGFSTFSFQVFNPNATMTVKVLGLSDNRYGDLAAIASTCGPVIGTTLAAGAVSNPCNFIGPVNGPPGTQLTDTVTVTGMDSDGNTVTSTAQATVTMTGPPVGSIGVTKTATPLSLPAPGGTFAFNVTVTNPDPTLPVRIIQLTDNVYGNLATRAGSTCGALIGTTLPTGTAAPLCLFSGTFSGVSGNSQTDTVIVTGMDTNGNTVTASASARVSLTAGAPTSTTGTGLPVTGSDPTGPLGVGILLMGGGFAALEVSSRRQRRWRSWPHA